MKYKSSLTREIKLAIILLILFWIINFFVIKNSNGIKDTVMFSLLMLCFITVFTLAFAKGIYIAIENSNVKYVSMFVLRKSVNIRKINRIQKGLMGGIYKTLLLMYEDNGKIDDMKIATLTFKKETLKQFESDLKNQNPNITIDQAVNY